MISVASADGKDHDVSAFFEMTGQLSVDNDRQNVSWARDGDDKMPLDLPAGAASMRIWQPEAIALDEPGFSKYHPTSAQPIEHLGWGVSHLTALPSTGGTVSSWMGSSNVARASFSSSGLLPTAGPRPGPGGAPAARSHSNATC